MQKISSQSQRTSIIHNISSSSDIITYHYSHIIIVIIIVTSQLLRHGAREHQVYMSPNGYYSRAQGFRPFHEWAANLPAGDDDSSSLGSLDPPRSSRPHASRIALKATPRSLRPPHASPLVMREASWQLFEKAVTHYTHYTQKIVLEHL